MNPPLRTQKDVDAIKKKMDEVNDLVQKMSTEMYQKVAEEQAKQQQAQKDSAGKKSEDSSDSDEKVVDAEYEEEKK